MKIPQQLYDLIYEARYEAKMSIEKCEWEFHNCQRIKSDGTLGKCCVKNFEIVIIYIFNLYSQFISIYTYRYFIVKFLLENKNNTFIFEIENLPQASLIKTEILLSLLPILKSWSGQHLTTDFVIYGIRRYTRGAWMVSYKMLQNPIHVDICLCYINILPYKCHGHSVWLHHHIVQGSLQSLGKVLCVTKRERKNYKRVVCPLVWFHPKLDFCKRCILKDKVLLHFLPCVVLFFSQNFR